MLIHQSVSTDPGNFTIQLISPNTPNAPTTLAKEVNTADPPAPLVSTSLLPAQAKKASRAAATTPAPDTPAVSCPAALEDDAAAAAC